MGLSTKTKTAIKRSIFPQSASAEVIAAVDASTAATGGLAPSTAAVHTVVTWSAATPAYAADGTLTIANGGTPTVVELQSFLAEVQRELAAINAILLAQGITA